MLSIFNGLRGLELYAIIFRLALAFCCGGLVGIERSYKNRPAGFRTHILVCVAACTASVTGIYLYINQSLPADISRIGAQVITGLGFLGAGTIIVTKDGVKGLTTAAGLWACGVIGLAIGAGFYEGGLLTAVLVLATEMYLSKLTLNMKRGENLQLMILMEDRRDVDPIMRYCKDQKISILNLQMAGFRDDDRDIISAIISLHSAKDIDTNKLLAVIRKMEGILDIQTIQ